MRKKEELENALADLNNAFQADCLLEYPKPETLTIAIEAVTEMMKAHERIREMTLQQMAAYLVWRINLWIEAHKEEAPQ